MRGNRRGFTLVELLVVIGILVLLTSIVVVAVANTRGTDRMRSAARTAQSAFLGARDRAIHAKEQRGIRLTRDTNDISLISGFEYVRPLPTLSYGGSSAPIEFWRVDADNNNMADNADVLQIRGIGNNIDWFTLDSNGLFDPNRVRVRIPAGLNGQWYGLVANSPNAPYFVQKKNNDQFLRLATPIVDSIFPSPSVVAIDFNSQLASLDLQLGNELLPFSQPITLASGVVIDLKWSSDSAKSLALPKNANDPVPAIDIMFSPRGGVTGPMSATGPIHFLLNDLQDAVSLAGDDRFNNLTLEMTPDGNPDPLSPIDPRNRGEKMVLTVFPQTGNVQAFPIDPTDANGDLLADDLFHFARIGSAAGN